MKLLEIVQAAQRGEFDHLLSKYNQDAGVVECAVTYVIAGKHEVNLEDYSTGKLSADTVRDIARTRKNHMQFYVGTSALMLGGAVTYTQTMFIDTDGCLHTALPVLQPKKEV